MTRRLVSIVLLLLTAAMIPACGGGSDPSSASALQGVSTTGVDSVTSGGARLFALVNPGGKPTTACFEYGTDPTLAGAARTAVVTIPAGNSPVPVSATVTGLPPGTTWFYRVVASNGSATGRGAIEYFGTDTVDTSTAVVNCTADLADPPPGKTTLRAAIAHLDPDGVVTFAPVLDGATIPLSIVADNHTLLPNEAYNFDVGAMSWEFLGYLDRDYGKSALYASKGLTIDAAGLAKGITIRWAGGDDEHARVLAVRGNLTMRNVTIRDGYSSSELIVPPNPDLNNQPYTLACGGGLAVWGVTSLEYCKLAENRTSGDLNSSRDRGSFGGGLFTDTAILSNCIVAGNRATGYGAAGGGIYSVGGVESFQNSVLTNCAINGNRATGHMAYGGGVFSDGGGPNNSMSLQLTNCTIARNLVDNHPDIPLNTFRDQYYWRGGGAYMSNGFMWLTSCTIAENEINGHDNVFSNKPNMGGGGIAATVGNAHVVEDMRVHHSILAGNRLNGVANDLFTGSVIQFHSEGYNRIGKLDFSGLLPPVPYWEDLNRKHYPKAGDEDGVDLSAVLSLSGVRRDAAIVSAGTDSGQKVVLWYPPAEGAIAKVPPTEYSVENVYAGYAVNEGYDDDFANVIVAKIAEYRGGLLGSGFVTAIGDRTGVVWSYSGPDWPAIQENRPWFLFWRNIDSAIAGRLGQVGLGDDFWGSFETGYLSDSITLTVDRWSSPSSPIRIVGFDQLGTPRPFTGNGAIGAIEPRGVGGFWGAVLALFR